MKKTKYFYNHETCQFEKIVKTRSDIAFQVLGYISTSVIFTFAFFVTYHKYYDSPKELFLKKENENLKSHYVSLQNEMNKIQSKLNELQDMDANVYRTILGSDPLPKKVLDAGFGGVDRYENLKTADKDNLILEASQRADKLKYQLKVQSTSYNEISSLAKNRTHFLSHTPAIQPVYNKDLKRISSSFGMRLHPIYKCRKMHKGQDFAVRTGTKVFATADGIIKKAIYDSRGGNIIIIDHGYGTVTKYMHLSKMYVKKGQRVVRGQKIALSGETGRSCAGPHLHYEVIKNRKHVNPIDYFTQDITPAQYREIQRLASRDITSMD